MRLADDDPVRIMDTSGNENRPRGPALQPGAVVPYESCVIDGGMGSDDVELHRRRDAGSS